MDQITLRHQMLAQKLTILEGDLEERVFACREAVQICLSPVTVSDRTCLRRLGNWLLAKCSSGIHPPDEILARVIDFALEASGPDARNPAAVFMSILKKELNYPA